MEDRVLWRTAGAGRTVRAAVLAAIVAAVAYIAVGLVADDPLAGLVQNLMLISGALLAGAAAWVRVGAAGPRRVWLSLVAYCALWAVAQGTWAYHEVLGRSTVPFPLLSAVALVLALPCGLGAAFAVPRDRAYRARLVLDALIIELSLLFAGWQLVVPPLMRAGASHLDVALGIGLILGDAAIVAAVIAALPRISRPWRAPARFVLWGLTGIAAADVAFVYLVLTGGYSTGRLSDLGWLCGFVAISAGALLVRPPTRVDPPSEPEPLRQSIHPWMLALPYLFVVPAIVTGYWLYATERATPPALVYLGGGVVVALLVRQMITLLENERRAGELERRVTYDLLTGLWNRDAIGRRIDHRLRQGRRVLVALLDIDDFKEVNDLHGWDGGDLVLVELARRVEALVGPAHQVARTGGDEFAIALPPAMAIKDAVAFASIVVERMRDPIRVHDSSMTVSVSVGLATATAPTAADGLLRRAGFAMHAAKRRGKNRYELYEPRLHADAVERIALAQQLERAVSEQQFVLHYQPVYDMPTGRIVGAEALIRWDHPQRGVVAPAQFIPVAETSAHIHAIGRWALGESCRLLSRLLCAGLVSSEFYVAVNVSPKQLFDETFPDAVTTALATAGVPGDAVVLELTESSLMDAVLALPILMDLRARGVRLAVDDFGTGYSSLAYLHRFPIDIVKIDRAFVADVDHGSEGRAVAQAILVLANSLRIQIVAEGVERSTQQDQLLKLGCHRAQGYYYSEPVPEDQLITLIGGVSVDAGNGSVATRSANGPQTDQAEVGRCESS